MQAGQLDPVKPYEIKFAPPPEGQGYYFDEFAADRAVAFFPRFLRHSIGKLAGQPFELDDWERQIVREVFGWKRADGTRRYRILYIEIPRKNGKTTLAAGIGLYLLFADGEPAAEVYSVATDTAQARISLTEGRRQISKTPFLLERSMQSRDAIVYPATMSAWRVLSATSGNKDGLNAHGVLFDEVHALRHRDLADLMHTSTGARMQPLEVYITTAGTDQKSYCWELHQRTLKVANGELVDPEFCGVIFAADPEDDIQDPETWKKANPSLGRGLSMDYMAAQARHAAEWPSYENAFKRLHLNIWTQQDVRWIPMRLWDLCNFHPVSLEELRGRECWGGLDLSTREDLTALALAAHAIDRPGFDIWVRAWCPQDTIELRARRDHVPYPQWAKDGWLVPTEGNAVDYDRLRRDISGAGRPEGSDEEAIMEIVDLRELGVDPWNASQLSSQLMGDGAPIISVRQGFGTMSPLSKQFESLIRRRELNHGGNPLLRWAAENVAIDMDAAENIKPSKVKSHQRIDPIVATIIAVGRAALADEGGGSIYDDEEAFRKAYPNVKVA